MEKIKEITKDNITLTHFRYIDDFGFWKDSFEMIKTLEDGRKQMLPFCGDIKVKTISRGDSINQITNYTEKEYEEMFEKNKF